MEKSVNYIKLLVYLNNEMREWKEYVYKNIVGENRKITLEHVTMLLLFMLFFLRKKSSHLYVI